MCVCGVCVCVWYIHVYAQNPVQSHHMVVYLRRLCHSNILHSCLACVSFPSHHVTLLPLCPSQELKFPGVQIGSHINDWNLDAPELQCVFQVRMYICVYVSPMYCMYNTQ